MIGAPSRVGLGNLAGRAADLLAGQRLELRAVLQLREVAIAAGHVGRGVEGGSPGEQPRVVRDQEQRLLPAHRAPDRIDAPALHIDAVGFRDRRHPREIGDLAGRAPRVPVEPAALAARVDHREVAEARQLAPEVRVLELVAAATVRGDDERDRLSVVARRQQEQRRSERAVVGPVVDQHRSCSTRLLWDRPGVGGGREEQHEQAAGRKSHPAGRYGRPEKIRLGVS